MLLGRLMLYAISSIGTFELNQMADFTPLLLLQT